MQDNLTLDEVVKKWHGSYRHYMIGFIFSIVLSGVAFFLVMAGLKGSTILYSIIGLAILQATGQLIFFLHLGEEAHPRWETPLVISMALVAAVIIIGSLWIMFDLDHRTMDGMPPEMSMFPQAGKPS
ncbi:MAG: cytochrome C oxidase subunit IV family protein [Rhabdochlamydiaceae bacterium]|jgi:cytochrome o ubiquinol oxidase operon protein cyoD